MPRIEGHDLEALSQREGGIWEVYSGRRPRPPSAELMNATLRYVDPDLGIVSSEYAPNPQFGNPWGQIMGGFLAAMLDGTMGASLGVTLQPDEIPQTIEMKVNYLRAAKLDTVISEGRVVRKGRSIAFIEGDLRNTDGELLATGTATFQIQQRR
jgi:uncharacterized protein (TIGR00369 family)